MYKMFRLYGGTVPPEIVNALVTSMNTERERGFGPFHQAWRAVQSEEWFATLPRGERGKVKAALNYTIKALEKKLPREAILAHLTNVIGLSPTLAENVVAFAEGVRSPVATL